MKEEKRLDKLEKSFFVFKVLIFIFIIIVFFGFLYWYWYNIGYNNGLFDCAMGNCGNYIRVGCK